MDKNIQSIEPQFLWENFYQLTRIPRPSHHEEKIRDFIFQFGKNLGLETIRDDAGNIIIRKPATPGMEGKKGVILQGHLDMVPQKNNDKVHDFLTDPIEAYIDGEWVTANGTTLGADNGIGVSAALSVLASDNIEHGPLEALFTATEETGMDGAEGLKAGLLNGDILLNMDSEEEGELYVGCAGGEDAGVLFHYSGETVPEGFMAFNLSVTGLKGGHSGMDIILQRGNSNKIFFRLLSEAYRRTGARLASVDGGSLRNAIPRETFGVIVVPSAKSDDLQKLINAESDAIKNELADTEPTLRVVLTETNRPAELIGEEVQIKLTGSILTCPDGVIRMSDSMPGLVETSSNMAAVKSDAGNKTISLAFLMRSSVDSAKTFLGRRLEALFTMAGAEVSFTGAYPGWKPNMDSPILKTMQQVYQSKYGKVPGIKAIHAGLECGILGGTYPHWDMISFGPTIRHPHSPDEKVDIASVRKFWEYLLETLKNIPSAT